MRTNIVTLLGCTASFFGLLLSAYSKLVSLAKTSDLEYQALCDINEYMSCSKIFTSEYGYGFGIVQWFVGKDSPLNVSNSVLGIAFYLLHFIGILLNHRRINIVLFWTSLLSIPTCVYLAYVLAYILHDFCVVCVSTYVVNVILLIINYSRMKLGSKATRLKSKKN